MAYIKTLISTQAVEQKELLRREKSRRIRKNQERTQRCLPKDLRRPSKKNLRGSFIWPLKVKKEKKSRAS